nr:hypothetical protein [Tanacetum cinerariifolium]
MISGGGGVFRVVRSSLREKPGGARGVSVGGEKRWNGGELDGRLTRQQAQTLILVILLSDLFSFLSLEDLGILMIKVVWPAAKARNLATRMDENFNTSHKAGNPAARLVFDDLSKLTFNACYDP